MEPQDQAGKERLVELLRRSLALKHKLKVHDTMAMPETHEQIAVHSVARWELEDELAAIEEILNDARKERVGKWRASLIKDGPKKRKPK